MTTTRTDTTTTDARVVLLVAVVEEEEDTTMSSLKSRPGSDPTRVVARSIMQDRRLAGGRRGTTRSSRSRLSTRQGLCEPTMCTPREMGMEREERFKARNTRTMRSRNHDAMIEVGGGTSGTD